VTPPVQQLLAGPIDGIRRSPVGLLQFGPAFLLRIGHPTLAAKKGGVESQDELTVGGDQEVEVVGEVLAEGEGLEAIQDHGLFELEVVQTLGVEGQGLAGESGVAVGQQSGRDTQGATGLAQTRTTDQEVLNQTVVDGTMDPVVDVEGTTGEALAAVAALEAGHGSQDLGGTKPLAVEPGKGGIRGDLVGGAVFVGTEGRGEGHG